MSHYQGPYSASYSSGKSIKQVSRELGVRGHGSVIRRRSKAIAPIIASEVSGPFRALEQAMRRHPGLRGVIHHRARGCQYTSERYRNALIRHRLKGSMSAQGNCYDNAAMESFWSTLKTECLAPGRLFDSKEQAASVDFRVHRILLQPYPNAFLAKLSHT